MAVVNNINQIKKAISQFEERFDRAPNSIRLLAVSKKQSIFSIEEAIAAEQLAFGENYLQEAIEKITLLHKKHKNLEWHYLGKIQKNKIKSLAQYFDWVQTIENEATAEKLNEAAEALHKKINVCLQVNISDEPQKNGVSMDKVENLVNRIVTKYPNLNFRGLMALGLATEKTSVLKTMFTQLRECYDALKIRYDHVDTLSIGMSADMAVAIECGSTMVRIGTAIFGERR